jgi:hypothetical protein
LRTILVKNLGVQGARAPSTHIQGYEIMSDFPSDFGSWSASLQQSFFLMRTTEADAEARKAEADAEARKAEADAAARKAEAEVRKAEISNVARSVGFEYLPIKVTHWNSLVSHYIQVPRISYSFGEFQIMVKLAFNDDITTDEFRLYLLPVDSEIDERILVNEERFSNFLHTILACSKSRLPSMFVWNYENSSPNKLPEAHEAEKSGSETSRSSAQSTACRDAYDSKCLCCNCYGETTSQEAAHIFDIGVYNQMGIGGKPFLRKLGLASINELANLICLCGSCHKKFDSFRLGIDPTEGMWTVNASERKERPEFYDLVHGKKIHFYANGTPPKEALTWKWLRFVEKNKARCCCLCDRIFPTDSSAEGEFDDHKLACKLKDVRIADMAVGGQK